MSEPKQRDPRDILIDTYLLDFVRSFERIQEVKEWKRSFAIYQAFALDEAALKLVYHFRKKYPEPIGEMPCLKEDLKRVPQDQK